MVGPGRFERPTSPLSGVRSNRLSYGPELVFIWRDVRTAPLEANFPWAFHVRRAEARLVDLADPGLS